MWEIFLGTSSGVYGIGGCDGCSFFASFHATQAIIAFRMSVSAVPGLGRGIGDCRRDAIAVAVGRSVVVSRSG